MTVTTEIITTMMGKKIKCADLILYTLREWQYSLKVYRIKSAHFMKPILILLATSGPECC